MSVPRVKRPFAGGSSDPAQRHITSFFARDDNDAHARRPAREGGRGAGHSTSAASLLPHSVQADLLAVGMRVRKSVPEGYKTGKEEADSDTVCEGRTTMTTVTTSRQYGARTQPPAPYTHELLPFCGIHRVGGLGVQTFEEGLYSRFEDTDKEPPSLTSSQETVSSSSSSGSEEEMTGSCTPPATRKRVYGSEEDEDDEVSLDDAGQDAISAILAAPPQLPAFCQRGRRVLAVPRRRQQQQQQPQPQPQPQLQSQMVSFTKTDGCRVRILGQENDSSGDFGEAAFLDLSAWADEQDMVMGGV